VIEIRKPTKKEIHKMNWDNFLWRMEAIAYIVFMLGAGISLMALAAMIFMVLWGVITGNVQVVAW